MGIDAGLNSDPHMAGKEAEPEFPETTLGLMLTVTVTEKKRDSALVFWYYINLPDFVPQGKLPWNSVLETTLFSLNKTKKGYSLNT